MARLNDADRANLERIMKSQLNETGWNFYNERQHVETLFYNRFNFFLMLYGMFVAAIASLECDCNALFECGLLIFAIIILILVWATLCRNYQTLRMILCILDKGLPAYHSSPILSEYMGKSRILRSRDLMAIWIPFCCIVSLALYLYYISGNVPCPFNYVAYLVLAIIPIYACFRGYEIMKYNKDEFLIRMLEDVVSRAKYIKKPCDNCVVKKHPIKQWILNKLRQQTRASKIPGK